MNRLRAGALRDLWTKKVPGDRLLSPDELRSLQERLVTFDQAYVLPAPVAFKPQWTLEAEQRQMKTEGVRTDDWQGLARRRFAARMMLEPTQRAEELL